MGTEMMFDTYKITSPLLSKYIQYILFNYSSDKSYSRYITSYANTNICLGIIKEKSLCFRDDGIKYVKNKPGIHSYLSGMYLVPHKFYAAGSLDEICIDFTPLGYYHFFKFNVKTYVFNEDILSEAFGKDGKIFFEFVFNSSSFQKRGQLIENFLLARIITPKLDFLEESLNYIHFYSGQITLRKLSDYMRSSEKKIVRSFVSYFDLTPKDYIRIVRFRKALDSLNENRASHLTSIGYDSNYYDQSHFIKDFHFFTEKTPRQIRDIIFNVKQDVLIGLE
ncbi:MAG TPA: helix-turn-helix domain-containing protein [Puia sp.]|jgi:AraC-like DNA-binding protein|nr:helix-turn-helix domain-containing protein [Puia sp.]